MPDYSLYDVEVIRTRTAQHRGLITVSARTPREAEVLAQTATPKRWQAMNDHTQITRQVREKGKSK